MRYKQNCFKKTKNIPSIKRGKGGEQGHHTTRTLRPLPRDCPSQEAYWEIWDHTRDFIRRGHWARNGLKITICTTEVFTRPSPVPKLLFHIIKAGSEFFHNMDIINFGIPQWSSLRLSLLPQRWNTGFDSVECIQIVGDALYFRRGLSIRWRQATACRPRSDVW